MGFFSKRNCCQSRTNWGLWSGSTLSRFSFQFQERFQTVCVDWGHDSRPQLLDYHNSRCGIRSRCRPRVLNLLVLLFIRYLIFLRKPVLLGPGVHIIDNPFFSLSRRANQTDVVISVSSNQCFLCSFPIGFFLKHQTLHRVIIPQGMRGVALDGDIPLLLQPGIYTRVSPTFQFKKACPVDEQVVELNPFLVITVFTSQVGVAYKRGAKKMLLIFKWIRQTKEPFTCSVLERTCFTPRRTKSLEDFWKW